MLQLRSIYYRLQMLRPDLRTAQIRMCLLDAARTVARRVPVLRETVKVTYPANAEYVALADLTPRHVTRVVRCQQLNGIGRPFRNIDIVNFNMMAKHGIRTGFGPMYCAHNENALVVAPLQDLPMTLKLVLAVQPRGEDEDMELEMIPEAEDAIVALACNTMFQLPGPENNKERAEEFKKDYKGALGNLKSIVAFGHGGTTALVVVPQPQVVGNDLGYPDLPDPGLSGFEHLDTMPAPPSITVEPASSSFSTPTGSNPISMQITVVGELSGVATVSDTYVNGPNNANLSIVFNPLTFAGPGVYMLTGTVSTTAPLTSGGSTTNYDVHVALGAVSGDGNLAIRYTPAPA